MPASAKGSLTVILPGQVPNREKLVCQFLPATIERVIEVQWGIAQPIKGSREVTDYRGTASQRLPLELFFTTMGRPSPGEFPELLPVVGDDMPHAIAAGARTPGLKGVERFLESLCYADQDQGLYRTPFIVFEWPNVCRVLGVMEDLRLRYEWFNSVDLRGTVLVATFTLREEAPNPISRSSVRASGAFRVTAAEIDRLAAGGGISPLSGDRSANTPVGSL